MHGILPQVRDDHCHVPAKLCPRILNQMLATISISDDHGAIPRRVEVGEPHSVVGTPMRIPRVVHDLAQSLGKLVAIRVGVLGRMEGREIGHGFSAKAAVVLLSAGGWARQRA